MVIPSVRIEAPNSKAVDTTSGNDPHNSNSRGQDLNIQEKGFGLIEGPGQLRVLPAPLLRCSAMLTPA